MNILSFVRDDGACGFYRVVQPLTTLATWMKDTGVAFFRQGEGLDRLLKFSDEADIIIIPRLHEEKFIGYMQESQKAGKKVIVDHDDNSFAVSPTSIHYKDMGTEEVEFETPNGLVKVWEDGRNIDISANKKRVEGFKTALRLADAVTTTTPILAEVFRQYNPNVYVLPNTVDPVLFQKADIVNDGSIRLGWFGGESHYDDWVLLRDVLPYIFSKYDNVRLVLMGARFFSTLKGIPNHKIEFHPWVPFDAYPYKAALLHLDVGLIPLAESEFNRCKSALKWMEMTALGVPTICSYVSPYKEIAKELNGVFVENEPDAWIEGLQLLIEGEEMRRGLAANAYEDFLTNHTNLVGYGRYFQTFHEVLEQKPVFSERTEVTQNA